MLEAIKRHYAPAWRYRTIVLDLVIAAIVFGLVVPSFFILWRFMWRTALGL